MVKTTACSKNKRKQKQNSTFNAQRVITKLFLFVNDIFMSNLLCYLLGMTLFILINVYHYHIFF